MGSQVSTIKAAAAWKLGANSKKNGGKGDKARIGILAFEVANLMSKSIQLWQSLSDQEILRLRTEIIKADGVLKLVSDNETVLLALACREQLENVTALARSVARLGKRCQDPTLQGFEHIYHDVLKHNIDVSGFEYSLKKMDAKMKKMEQYIASTSNLYQELEILADLEQAARRVIQDDDSGGHQSLVLEQKITWQRQEVKYLRDISLWNNTFDKIVTLLAQTVCTIYRRIMDIFTSPMLGLHDLGPLHPDPYSSSHSNYPYSSQLYFLASKSSMSEASQDACINEIRGDHSFANVLGLASTESQVSNHAAEVCRQSPNSSNASSASLDFESYAERCNRLSPVSCLWHTRSCQVHRYPGVDDFSLSSSSSSISRSTNAYGSDSVLSERYKASLFGPGFSKGCLSPTHLSKAKSCRLNLQESRRVCKSKYIHGPSIGPFISHEKSLSSTVGGAALALHYANVIIVLENMVRFPQLIGDEARDDLYRMLPRSVQVALRSRLKFCPKDSTRFDAVIAEHWREVVADVLCWLTPLAHNTIRWQSEHNFEQQVVSRTNVLLLQTLHFANRAKTESAITELLVGLNHICWHEKENKSNQLDSASSSNDLEEYLDWQL